MEAQELLNLAMALKRMGAEVEVDPEELKAYYPQTDESLYMPTNLPDSFYYDAPGLRKLSTVNSGVFRRLLGLK